jgi:hypothetical protein
MRRLRPASTSSRAHHLPLNGDPHSITPSASRLTMKGTSAVVVIGVERHRGGRDNSARRDLRLAPSAPFATILSKVGCLHL